MVISFLQSTKINTDMIEETLQQRQAMGQLRLAGTRMLRGLLEELRLQKTVSRHHYIHAMIAKAFAGRHFHRDIAGGGSAILTHVTGAISQLIAEVVRSLETTQRPHNRYWAELAVALLSMPFVVGDYAMLCQLRVPRQLLRLCSIEPGQADPVLPARNTSSLASMVPPLEPFPAGVNHNLPLHIVKAKLTTASPSLIHRRPRSVHAVVERTRQLSIQRVLVARDQSFESLARSTIVLLL